MGAGWAARPRGLLSEAVSWCSYLAVFGVALALLAEGGPLLFALLLLLLAAADEVAEPPFSCWLISSSSSSNLVGVNILFATILIAPTHSEQSGDGD